MMGSPRALRLRLVWIGDSPGWGLHVPTRWSLRKSQLGGNSTCKFALLGVKDDPIKMDLVPLEAGGHRD